MKEKMNKLREFVKSHKKEIAVGLGVTALTGIALYFGVKIKNGSMEDNSVKIIDIPNNYFIVTDTSKEFAKVIKEETLQAAIGEGKVCANFGCVDNIWSNEFGTNMIVNNVNVGNVGEFFKSLSGLDEITDETQISLIVHLLND